MSGISALRRPGVRSDLTVAGIVGALAYVGVAAIFRAESLVGSQLPFGRRQLLWWVPATLFLLIFRRINFRTLCRWSYAFFAVSIVLLVIAFFFPEVNGSHRWIRIGPIGLQPSEFAKLAMIVALARYLMYCESQQRWRGLIAPFVIALVPMILVLREPDLGTALVFLPVLLCMLVAAGSRVRDLCLAGVVGVCLLPLIWQQMSREQRSRVTALWEQTGPGEQPTADGYHLHQSKQVLALGGFWGSLITGDVTSDREVYYLPVAHSDFIFSIIGERFGWWGAGLTLLLFAILVTKTLRIAQRTREPFGRLLCVGVAGMFAVEVVINTAMTVGLAPITGLSLPLVSYGGSGLVAHALALAFVLSVARHPGYELGAAPFRFRES